MEWDLYHIASLLEVLNMKIGFIGAGKAGTSLGIHFKKNNILVSGYYSKSKNSSKKAADYTKSTVFYNLEEVVVNSDMIFITTPDGIIKSISKDLMNFDISEKIICHCSGALASNELEGAKKAVSAHPMMAISSRETDLSTAVFTIEGNDEGKKLLKEIFAKTNNIVKQIDSQDKTKYHCAAVSASNLMIGIAKMSIEMLEECGFSEDDAMGILKPILKNNIMSLCDKGPQDALTGPVERCDENTVEKHLNILSGNERDIYRLLSLKLVDIARAKNIDKNYNSLQEKLEEVK